jgi:hypothetical protein
MVASLGGPLVFRNLSLAMDDAAPRTEIAFSSPALESRFASADAPDEQPLAPLTVEASQPFVGRWNHLVSTTNWEKGRIIAQWRAALEAQQLPIAEFSDEAWARLVGGVTGQHAGRLRRVYQRFGEVYEQYGGLYWSHFQAAIDWTDAEMWLEGAVQNGWSVSAMRRTRWETLGAPPEQTPRAEEVVASETDEDFEPARKQPPSTIEGRYDEVQGPDHGQGPDFGDEPSSSEASEHVPADFASRSEPPTPLRPFENLPALPDDVAEAFEQFKLVILRHKSERWSDISRDDLLATLDSLKQLALAPAFDEAPF